MMRAEKAALAPPGITRPPTEADLMRPASNAATCDRPAIARSGYLFRGRGKTCLAESVISSRPLSSGDSAQRLLLRTSPFVALNRPSASPNVRCE
jgi:hypothetical protein